MTIILISTSFKYVCMYVYLCMYVTEPLNLAFTHLLMHIENSVLQ